MKIYLHLVTLLECSIKETDRLTFSLLVFLILFRFVSLIHFQFVPLKKNLSKFLYLFVYFSSFNYNKHTNKLDTKKFR